jgi:hypothetical protein
VERYATAKTIVINGGKKDLEEERTVSYEEASVWNAFLSLLIL